MDQESLECLFTNEEYAIKDFKFGDLHLRIKCLNAASTDYDLTGQIVWPASSLLAQYLASNPAIMTGRKAACELGSGLGLTGLVCGQFCDIVLADHNEIVLRVLQENIDSNASQHQVRCHLTDWESANDISALKRLTPDAEGFELVLGADICYSIKAVPFIFRALSSLLSRQLGSQGLLGYVSRAAAIDRQIYTEALKAGLQLEELPGTRGDVGGGLEGAIFSFTHMC